MAVTSTRLGRVLPGTTRPGISSTSDEYDFDFLGDLALTSTSSGGSSVPRSYYDALGAAAKARAQTAAQNLDFDVTKYQAEQQAAADALARQRAGAVAQQAYLKSQLGAKIPTEISGEIAAQEKAGQEYIANQAAALLEQLNARKAQGEGLTQTGYSNLMNYLARNQPTAFAQAQRAMPTITETGLGQYMAGQGVSPAAAQEAARLANIQAAGGASNYNQLLNVLAAREAAGQQSRQSEAEMGLASQLALLQGIYGQAAGGLEQSRLSALADLASRTSAARLQAQREASARDQAIRDAIAQLVGTGLVPAPAPTIFTPAPAPSADTSYRPGTPSRYLVGFRYEGTGPNRVKYDQYSDGTEEGPFEEPA